jgi:anthranilate phosphoribosyltransferase
MKGETIEEITGFVEIMREVVVKVRCTAPEAVDTCGTGGDRQHTFNISTLSALVAAGAGAVVAKHGNRAVSSHCGSADILKSLGVNIEASREKVEECLEKIGIGFLFAPLLHPAMKYAIGPRREMGIRTVFNILGPLTNPAQTKRQVIGVYDGKLTEPLAAVLRNLKAKHILVVHGGDGLDELTTTTESKITELVDGKIKTYTISPEQFQLRKNTLEELKVAGPEDNKKIFLEILAGKRVPQREIVLLNAGAVIYVAGKAETLAEGIKKAEISISSGAAEEKLKKLVEMTN